MAEEERSTSALKGHPIFKSPKQSLLNHHGGNLYSNLYKKKMTKCSMSTNRSGYPVGIIDRLS